MKDTSMIKCIKDAVELKKDLRKAAEIHGK